MLEIINFSRFKRIRVNPSNMLIRRADFTFAYRVGNPIKFGTGGDCYSKSKQDCRKGGTIYRVFS